MGWIAATFHEEECRDILLCTEESSWDDSMDEALTDIIAGAVDSIRDIYDVQKSEDTEGASMLEEMEAEVVVVMSKDPYRDVMSLYPSRDPVCQEPPALRSLDSEMSISSTSSASLFSFSSRNFASRTWTRQMSPHRNAEWAILE